MKKLIVSVLATGLFFVSQIAMAAGTSGIVVLDEFNDERSAVTQAKSTVAEIEAGKNKAVIAAAANRCQNFRRAKFNSNGFTVSPVWVEKGNDFEKEYLAKVNYNISCDLKVSPTSIYN